MCIEIIKNYQIHIHAKEHEFERFAHLVLRIFRPGKKNDWQQEKTRPRCNMNGD